MSSGEGLDETRPLVRAQPHASPAQFVPPRPSQSNDSIAMNHCASAYSTSAYSASPYTASPYGAHERHGSPIRSANNALHISSGRRSSQNSLTRFVLIPVEQTTHRNTHHDREDRRKGLGSDNEEVIDDIESDGEVGPIAWDDHALRSLSISSSDSNYTRAPQLRDPTSNAATSSRKSSFIHMCRTLLMFAAFGPLDNTGFSFLRQ